MLLALLACQTPDSASKDEAAGPAPDLTETLGADQSRAGVVTDTTALFGGVSAEGRAGDTLIYNDRARFVIQQPGDSSYYVDYGGQLIDADIVRPAGEPGRDMLDELGFMWGLGLIVDATTVEVVSDGSTAPAMVRVTGTAAPMRLLSGALESDSLFPDVALTIVTEYTLEPGSPTLKVHNLITNNDTEAVSGQPGLLGIYAPEVADPFRSGDGRQLSATEFPWSGIYGHHNEAALLLMAETGTVGLGTAGMLVDAITSSMSAFGETVTIEPAATATFDLRVGVAEDPAVLSGAQLTWQGAAAKEVSGTLNAPGGRVHILDADGSWSTVAHVGADGTWSATVPSTAASYVATGRGTGRFLDLPAGHAWISPYDVGGDAAISTLTTGAPVAPFAEGWGVGEASTTPDLTLTPPGVLEVTVADGGPAVIRLNLAADVSADERFVPGRPDGTTAIGWVRDGGLSMTVEPGDYTLVAHRGLRDEADVQTVHVESGATTAITVAVPAAYTLDGVVVGDPHVHASPSGDASVPMEDRLLTMAANGVDVHFGTDHDHVADYRPLIPAMGLEDRLMSVVADEVSPVMRGHFNAWPATIDPAAANHGAPRWWFGYADTCEIFGWMRELVGDGVIQANHPAGSSGMFTLAGYDAAGNVAEADHWCEDFQAMETINSGEWEEYFPFYLDLSTRGFAVTPTGVSDTHSYTSGGLGMNVTFFHTGTTLATTDDAALVAAVAARETVASKGPYLDVRVDGAWAPGRELVGATVLDVTVWAPSWMPVTEVTLYQDGIAVDTATCTGAAPTWCSAQFSLSPAADAAYVVTASSTSPMTTVHSGNYAFAVASAVRVDVDGDGWSAAKGPLVFP